MPTHVAFSPSDASAARDTASNLQTVKVLRRLAAEALQQDDAPKAHTFLCKAKSLKTPVESIDYLRGVTFLKNGDPASAREALKEELRYFPDNRAAQDLLNEISRTLNVGVPQDEEFRTLYDVIRPYTMVGLPRLYSLYTHAREVCEKGPLGNFVECGVAGGGSSGLLSAVIARFAPSRRLFSCDSFDGMPPATEFDMHNGRHAEDSGWGTGTCASPENSVLPLCERLGTRPLVTTVKGYFEDTLPVWRERFGPIAFLHMDGDWYASTKTILDTLYDALAPAAYVQVDDFGHWEGCRKAVTEFFEGRGIALDAYAIDESGIWFRKPATA